MCTRLLFITDHVGSESASDICENLNEMLLKTIGLCLKHLEKA